MYKVCLYEENHKTLINQSYKCRECLYSWIGRLNTVKMLVLPNLIYRFNIIPIKTPASYFVDTEKLILKFTWKAKDPEEPTQYGRRRIKLGVCRQTSMESIKAE